MNLHNENDLVEPEQDTSDYESRPTRSAPRHGFRHYVGNVHAGWRGVTATSIVAVLTTAAMALSIRGVGFLIEVLF